MSKANFNSLGNDFSVNFSIDDLSGRAQANLLRALIEKSCVIPERGSEAEKVVNQMISALWERQ